MKLVGEYRVTVASVDVTTSKAGNPMLKLGLDFTGEHINGELHSIDLPPRDYWFGGLDTKPTRNGKSPAQMTVQTLRDAFDYKKGFNELHELVFAQADAVCNDDGGKFTRIAYLNNVNRKPRSAGLTELSSDVKDELEKIFSAVA